MVTKFVAAQPVVPVFILGATAAALEEKRQHDGLTHRQVAAALELTPAAYWNLTRIPCASLRPATCGRIARWLAVPVEDVLRWEDYWDRYSLVGRLFVVAILEANSGGLGRVAQTIGVKEATFRNALRYPYRPSPREMTRWDTWVNALGLDIQVALRRAARGMPVRPLRGIVKKVLETEGRSGLVKRSRRQGKNSWKRMSPEERHALASSGGVAAQSVRRSMTAEEREQLSQARLGRYLPRPKGRHGICRVCRRWTFTNILSGTRRRVVQYHRTCRAQLPRGEAGFGASPEVPYGRGRRLDPNELATHYAVCVEYLRLKLGVGAGSDPAPETVRELAVSLALDDNADRAERELYRMVRRFLKLLPELKNCSRELARKVKFLRQAEVWLPPERISDSAGSGISDSPAGAK